MKIKKGKQRFNLKPKDGIKYLVGIGYIQETPQQIATLLRKSDGLDKQQIGEYLGGKDDLNRKVLYEYVDLHFDFKVSFSLFFSLFSGMLKKKNRIWSLTSQFGGFYHNLCYQKRLNKLIVLWKNLPSVTTTIITLPFLVSFSFPFLCYLPPTTKKKCVLFVYILTPLYSKCG